MARYCGRPSSALDIAVVEPTRTAVAMASKRVRLSKPTSEPF
jgi:hypothetical protein